MIAKTMEKIYRQVGCLTDKDIQSIRADLPNPSLPVLLKCGMNSRVVPMSELEHQMASVEREGDYVRYVSLPLANMEPWHKLGYPRR